MNRKRDEHSLGILGRVYWKKKKKFEKTKSENFFKISFSARLFNFRLLVGIVLSGSVLDSSVEFLSEISISTV